MCPSFLDQKNIFFVCGAEVGFWMACVPLNQAVYFASTRPTWENIFPQSPKC